MPDEPLKDPYEVKPDEKKDAPPAFVPPVPIVEGPDPEPPEDPDHADALQHRGPAILGYAIFLIPLLLAPKSKFARYHSNQALLVFIMAGVLVVMSIGLKVITMILGWVLPGPLQFINSLFGCAFWLVWIAAWLAFIALAIVGIINAANLEKKPLPLIGNFTLIKEDPGPEPAKAPAEAPAPAPKEPLK